MARFGSPRVLHRAWGFNKQEVLTSPPLLFALDEVEYISEAATKQLRILSEFAVETCYSPLPAGQVPVGMPAEGLFATFVAAFRATLEYNMKGAQAVSKNRVLTLREEMEQLQKAVEVYLRRHYKPRLKYKGKAREVLFTATNGSGMIDLAKQGGVPHRAYQNAPPRSGTGIPMPTLAFTRLRELVEECAGSSPAERQMVWTQAPKKVIYMRKGAPSTAGQWTSCTQGRAGAGGGGSSTFKARMLERGTSPGVCDLAWRGDVCRRINCSLSHLLPSSTAPPVTVQQQQLHALPPPSPPPPALQQQPPQHQAAVTAGGGAEGGGARASRPLRVSRFNRHYAPGGYGGASAWGGAGRGAGSNWQYGPCHLAGPTGGGTGAREEWIIFVDPKRSVGMVHAPSPGSVSPALFYGESRVPRNKNR